MLSPANKSGKIITYLLFLRALNTHLLKNDRTLRWWQKAVKLTEFLLSWSCLFDLFRFTKNFEIIHLLRINASIKIGSSWILLLFFQIKILIIFPKIIDSRILKSIQSYSNLYFFLTMVRQMLTKFSII